MARRSQSCEKRGKNIPGRGPKKYKGRNEFSVGETECGWSVMGKGRAVRSEEGKCLITSLQAMVENLGSLHDGKTLESF